jgi:hypothetical protein
MGLWNHQEVGGSQRLNILEGEAIFVLIDLGGGDLPGHDLTENAVVHGNSLLTF